MHQQQQQGGYSQMPNNPMMQPPQPLASGYNPQHQQQPNQNQQYQQQPQTGNYQPQNQYQQPGGFVDQPPMQQDQFNEQDHQPQVPGYLLPPPNLDMQQNWWQSWEQMDKPNLNKNYRLFRVPKMKEEIAESTIIGVIDQSGSMGDCFHWLAKEWNEQIYKNYPRTKCCVFHNFAIEQQCLEEHPDMGTTDVEAGFKLLNDCLKRDETLGYVTIIFVSDGMDNNPNSIYGRLDALISQIPKWKKINFLTIGVGQGFPTYMAMQLRQMYHNGENNIPPVFLVYNQHVHENWKVTFEIVNKYLKHNDPVQMNSVAQQFPWQNPTSVVYENSWVFNTNMNTTSLNFNGLEVKNVEKLTPQEVLDIGTILTSNAQLSNLKFNNEETTKAEAIIAQKILDDLKKKFWGNGNKKKEEKEQLLAVQTEMKDLEKDPDLGKRKNESGGDSSLALKLAVGAIGAGVGLYWLANNYGDFAQMMGQMNFAGSADCGCCGQICGNACDFLGDQCQCCGDIADKITGCEICDGCGDKCGDLISAGEGCMGTCCQYFCEVLGYVANFICGLLG